MSVFLLFGLGMPGTEASAYLSGLSQNFMRQAGERFGREAVVRIESWRSEELKLAKTSETTMRLLEKVNDAANAYEFSEDSSHWGVPEYWATPTEFVASGRGDCEDYAIAKYYALLAAGIEPSRLRFIYARALVDKRLINHMVIAYYERPEAEPLVLDNLHPQILAASRRPDLLPVFSFNDDERGGAATARRWRELGMRIRKELDT